MLCVYMVYNGFVFVWIIDIRFHFVILKTLEICLRTAMALPPLEALKCLPNNSNILRTRQNGRRFADTIFTLRWRHNDHVGVSNHQPHHCLLNCLFERRSKKTSKLRVTGLCAGNSPGTSEFPAQMASNAENVSIWWRYNEIYLSQWRSLSLD